MSDTPSIDIRPDHWEIVQSVLHRHVPQHEVWAFGSRAKWTAKEYSDLDLAVITDKPLSLDVIAGLSDDFSESDLPYKVDVVDWATTNESFKKIIERDRVVVQKVGRGWGVGAEWIDIPLGEVVTLQRGIDLPVQDRRVGSVPVVASTGIVGFHNEAPVRGPGVVIGRSGSIGGGQFIKQDFWPLNTTLWVKDFNGNDPRYCYYLLRSIDFSGLNTGSGVPTLNRNHLHPLQVRRPPVDQQRVIANILGGLDDKIDLNRRINLTLEAMAQAIFKSWFVDFDPVKAKISATAEGRDPLRAAMSAISGKAEAELDALPREQYQQLAATAVLFPDEMEKSELGEIPKGWKVQRVGSVLELVYGKSLKSTDRKEGTVPVYGSGGITGFHSTPLVTHGSIIVGRKGTVGSLYWEDEPFFPIDTTYYVEPLAAPLTFCYYTMQTLGLEKMNTDAAVPGLNRENVYRLDLVLPDSAILKNFDSIATTLRKAIRANSDENKSLAYLRDTLLPKLLSGELSVAALSKPVQPA